MMYDDNGNPMESHGITMEYNHHVGWQKTRENPTGNFCKSVLAQASKVQRSRRRERYGQVDVVKSDCRAASLLHGIRETQD